MAQVMRRIAAVAEGSAVVAAVTVAAVTVAAEAAAVMVEAAVAVTAAAAASSRLSPSQHKLTGTWGQLKGVVRATARARLMVNGLAWR